MRKTKFGEIRFDAEVFDTPIPTIEVVLYEGEDGEDNEKIIKIGYLHPFRGYRFQVSGAPEGVLDHGSSQVIGLSHCLRATYKEGYGSNSNLDPQGISQELLRGQAALAVIEFCHHWKAEVPSMFSSIVDDKKQIDKFIVACYEFLLETSGK